MTFKVCKHGMKEGIIFDAREVHRTPVCWKFMLLDGEYTYYSRAVWDVYLYFDDQGWLKL